MSENPINQPPDPSAEQVDAAFLRLTPNQQLLLNDPYDLIPGSQAEVDAAGPSDPAQAWPYKAGKLEWEKEELDAAKRILSQDLATTTEAHQNAVSQLQDEEAKTAHLAIENAGLREERDSAQKTAILNFQKVAGLREERDELEKKAELADVDFLTGTLNRRGLEEKYKELVRSSSHRRDNHTDAILFIDADHFKEVNAILDHDGGDEALKIIAKTLAMQIRESDVAGRWGGDEFIVILPDVRKDDAAVVAEKIRAAVAELKGMPIPISVSIGVDTIDRTKKLSQTAKFADKAMKEAKRQGRNQVIAVDLSQQ